MELSSFEKIFPGRTTRFSRFGSPHNTFLMTAAKLWTSKSYKSFFWGMHNAFPIYSILKSFLIWITENLSKTSKISKCVFLSFIFIWRTLWKTLRWVKRHLKLIKWIIRWLWREHHHCQIENPNMILTPVNRNQYMKTGGERPGES